MRILLVLPAAVLATAAPSLAVTWHVLSDGSGDAPTIQAALQGAASGDTVEAACGTYYESGIELKGGVVLRSATGLPGCVTVDAMQQGPVLRCLDQSEPPRVHGLTISGGAGGAAADSGGGGLVCRSSDPVLTDCAFTGNTAGHGGGMACYDSDPSLERCVFTSNEATSPTWAAGGAIFSDRSAPLLRHCMFLDNQAFSGQAPGDGGGVFSQKSSLHATACVFEDNTSGAGGGGFYSFDEDLSILIDCSFARNSSQAGGAVYLETSYAELIGCTFVENTAANGGALFTESWSAPILRGCDFVANEATPHSGGAVDCWHTILSIEDCTFQGNTAVLDGGAFAGNGVCQPEFDGCRFVGNAAGHRGGAFCGTYAASVDFLACTLNGNTAGSTGGAMYLSQTGTVHLERTLVAFSQGGGTAVECTSTTVTAACTDVYGNDGGDWTACLGGMGGSDGNLAEDPLFCGAGPDDVTVLSTSPCLPAFNGCGVLIGAGEQACLDPTSVGSSVEPRSWGAVKALYRRAAP